MTLRTELYLEQLKRRPKAGRHILAHFDAGTVVVYQAYRPAIVGIEDISEFVAAQRECALSGDFTNLWTPSEDVLPVRDTAVAARLGIDGHRTGMKPPTTDH